MLKKITLSVLAFILSFSMNAQWWGSGEKIKGNGNVVTEKRSTSSYDAVAVGGSFDVVLVEGKEGNLKLSGEENLLQYIETEVNNGTLKIRVKRNTNLRITKKLVVTVPITEIDDVSLGGSGNISNQGTLKSRDFRVSLGGSGTIDLNIDVSEVSTNIGGSGNIKLRGNSNEMSCNIAGSGTIKAYELKVNSLDAVIAGSGDIRSFVKSRIKAKVVGSGSIYYKGNPDKIDTKSLGSGSVVKKD